MRTSREPRRSFVRGDIAVLIGIAGVALLVWFLYIAIQPRDYARAFGSANRLDTIFGWRAPAISPRDLIERDRLLLAMAGWLVIGLVAGRLRPRLWPFIGPAAMLPVMLVFSRTAPHDAQGYWVFNVAYLVAVAGVMSLPTTSGGLNRRRARNR